MHNTTLAHGTLLMLTRQLCVCLLITIVMATQTSAASASNLCSSPHYDETAQVKYVHDGDTLKLKDGRKIRLIGINTPEMARDKTPAQPYAQAARDQLRSIIKRSKYQIKLIFGKEPRDRYGRYLAHIYTSQGDNIQAEMVSRGLAVANTYPPNQRFSDCYQRVETQTICLHKGIWSHPDYAVKTPTDFNTSSTGYQIFTARLNTIKASAKGLWLSFDGGIIATIKRQDLIHFDRQQLDDLRNQQVILRGWLHPAKSRGKNAKYFIRLRHPDSISLKSTFDTKLSCRSQS